MRPKRIMILIAVLHATAAGLAFAETVPVAPVEGKAAVNATASAGQAAATSKPSKTAGAAKGPSTDVSFEDLLVQGKYHFTDEAVTTVEEDKVLDALLGTRTDFKDRIKKSAARQ